MRWVNEADVDGIYQIFSDEEVIRYWSSPAMRERQEAEAYLASIHSHFAAKDLFQWGIAVHSQGWGKGYGREALRLLLGFCFGELDLHRLEADIDPDNARSLALFEREGFQREGFLRERWLAHGAWQDTILLGLVARDWNA